MFNNIPTFWQAILKGFIIWACVILTICIFSFIFKPYIFREWTSVEIQTVEKDVYDINDLRIGEEVRYSNFNFCVSTIQQNNLQAASTTKSDPPITIYLRPSGQCK